MARGVPEFRRALIQLGAALDGDVGKLVAAMGQLSVPDALRLVTDAYPDLSSPYLAAAADLTATWYEDQPTDQDAEAYTAIPADLPDVEQLAANARWALTQKSPTKALLGAGRRQLFQQHRDTVLLNVEREGVRWAREARPGACGSCRMLATRVLTEGLARSPGLYKSEGSAERSAHTKDGKGHDHCRCVAVPIRGGEPYTVPGYVHDWLDDYDAVSRDESGKLLKPWQIADRMERRASERGEPVGEDVTGDHGAAPAVVDLDAGTAGRRAPLALPAGASAQRLAIEAPQAQVALNRPPIVLGTGRAPRELVAAPTRLAIEARKVPTPDPGAIAEWLDAEDDHRAAVEYWRRVDDEDLHSLPPDEAIPEPPASDEPEPVVEPVVEPAGPRTKRDVLRDAVAAAEAAAAEPDERRSASAKRKQQRREARRLALKQARLALADAEADGSADEPIAEQRKRAKARPAADVEAERVAAFHAEMDRAVAAFNEACETGDGDAIDRAADHMEAIEAAHNEASARAAAAAAKLAERTERQRQRRDAERQADQERIYQLIEGGDDPQDAEATVVAERTGKDHTHVLEQIRRRDFMQQARADGHFGKGFDDLIDSVFQRRVDELYMEAEEATNGQMVKRPHVLTFNPKKFWYVNDATARRYMTEELAQWFDENGRITRPVFRQMVLDGSTNFGKYDAMTQDYNQ